MARRIILVILSALLITCLLAAVMIAIYWKTLVLDGAENGLRAVFKGSSVKIGSREVSPEMLAFRDIEITTNGRQILSVGEFRFDFTVTSLIKGRTADFSAKEISVYEKLKIDEARGLARFDKGILALGNISVSVLSGIVEGGALIKPGKDPSWSVALNLKDIRLEKAIETFELGEKMSMSGSVSGPLRFSGEGKALAGLKGKLAASPEGGVLTINDQKWLDTIARYAKQDISVIVESFKDYSYNEGTIRFGLKGTSIIMEAHLNGEQGKRDLLISLRDFN